MKNYSFILTIISIFVITHKSLISGEQACHIFDIAISWETRKIQTLFRLKDNKLYQASKIYYGVRECGEDCIGETKRNTIKRWSEHDETYQTYEPCFYLEILWKILSCYKVTLR